MSDLLLPHASLAFAGVVSIAVLLSAPRALQSWLFFAGMLTLGAVAACDAFSLQATTFDAFIRWNNRGTIARSLLAGVWLAFSVCYARQPGVAVASRSRRWLPLLGSLPVLCAIWAVTSAQPIEGTATSEPVFYHGPAEHALNVLLLVCLVVALMNLEATFRASIGLTRWKVKFVTLGLAVIFGAQLYTRSQALLFSGKVVNLAAVEASSLLLGSILIGIGWWRGGFHPLQIVPSRASLAQSVTVFLVGGYLFVVGVLAQAITLIGGAANFQTQALLVLVGIVCLGVLMLSDRLRLKLQHSFSRYFGRPYYDFRKVWTVSSERLSHQADPAGLCAAAARLIAETFNSLSVRIWLLDESRQRLTLGASTAPTTAESKVADATVPPAALNECCRSDTPFNLEEASGPVAELLREASSTQFRHGGERLAVPLTSNGRNLGVAILADRVNGVPYTPEESDLLRCVAAQISATLLTLRVSGELVQAKELEAFQTMSAFFVHDLKNTVSTLNLMLQNLPVHFDNPEFRKDALRGIGNTVARVNHLIGRLSALRKKIELRPVETNISELVQQVVGQMKQLPGATFTAELAPTACALVDPEHFGSVVSNLLLNAKDAIQEGGTIHVKVTNSSDRVITSVTDNGSGMTPEFMANSLFRPFSSTKNKGLGIGMFQCKVLVEAHRGTIEVESEPGKGTTVRVSLPALAEQ